MQKPGPDGAAGTARPLSVAPAQWDEGPLLVNFCSNVPRGRKAKEGEKRRKLPGAGKVAGCRNCGRKRERLQAAHRRAGVVLGGCWAGFSFPIKFFGLR